MDTLELSGSSFHGVHVTSHHHSPHPKTKLNLKNHCIFCLHQEQDSSVISKVLKKNLENSDDFKCLLNYLTGKELNFENELFVKMGFSLNRLPPMCEACYNGVTSLNALHQQLISVQCSIQIQTERIREKVNQTIKKKKVGGGGDVGGMTTTARERFDTAICNSSGMSTSEAMKICHFIKKLHDSIIVEGKSPVTFPSKLPSKLLSNVCEVEDYSSDNDCGNSMFDDLINDNDDKEDAAIDSFSSVSVMMDTRGQEGGASTSENDEDETWSPDTISTRKRVKLKTKPANPNSSTSHQNISESEKPLRKKRKNTDEDWNPSASFDDKKGSFLKKKYKYARIRPKKGKSQKCDLCLQKIPCGEMEQHMRFHVNDYAVRCLWPQCPFWFPCIYKMEVHVQRNRSSSKAGDHKLVTVPETFMKRFCPVCEFTCVNHVLYRNHLDVHENEIEDKPLECPIADCNKRFSLRESVESHINYHKDLKPIKSEQECHLCQQTLPVKEMEQHLEEIHEISEPVSCKHCNFVFADRSTLLEHIFEHRDEKGIACDICPDDGGLIKFRRLVDLRQHYLTIHKIGTIENKSFVCEHCSTECDSLKGLKIHQTLSHPEFYRQNRKQLIYRQSFPCDLCFATFKNKDRYFDHKIKSHGAPPLKCKLCEESFLKYDLFRTHEKQHKGLINELKCTVEGCEKTFSKKSALRAHELSVHPGGAKPFKCDLCEKAYWTGPSLKTHKDSAHLGKREICEECGDSFTNPSSLRRHKLIHTGERPYNCHICGQAFRHKEVMQTHVNSHERRGDHFRPNGPMKHIRKRVERD